MSRNRVENLFEPIGKLVVTFQELEFITSAFVIELMNTPGDIGLAITSEMSFARLVHALVSLAEVRLNDNKLLEEIKELAKQLNHCQQNRNIIIHSFYVGSEHRIMRLKSTAKQRSGLQPKMREITTGEIQQHTEQIVDTKHQMARIARRLKQKGLVSDAFFRN